MTAIYLYNTESRRKELLEPQEPGHVRLYTCGPTVYNFAHIGNFRAYIFEDLLRRTLKYFGLRVTQVMNLTDIDDKTLRGAIASGVSLAEFTRPYIEAFFADLRTLNIEAAEYYPAATSYVPSMIALIEKLMSKGMAYRGGDGSVYFPIHLFQRYGCLSHLKLEDLQAGASDRVAADEYDKEHVADFALWKAYDPARDGSIFWESPFGRGRPGWHLECSAMAMALLGDTVDIHVGGIDNMFPHHENEIAQSEAATGKRFVNIWMHCDHLVVDGRKMSKSFGNFYTLRDLLSLGYSGREVRLMLLQTHYKTPLNFTLQGLDGVRAALHRLDALERRLKQLAALAPTTDEKGVDGELSLLFTKAEEQFAAALADDLNISAALAALFDLVRHLNTLCDREELTPSAAVEALQTIRDFDPVLAIFKEDGLEIPSDVLELVERRQQARREKAWQLADQIRQELLDRGYSVEDTPHGPRLQRKETL